MTKRHKLVKKDHTKWQNSIKKKQTCEKSYKLWKKNNKKWQTIEKQQ